MPSTTTAELPKINEPFSLSSSADVIIRSADNIDFFAQKSILSLASPILADMFAHPQPGHEQKDTVKRSSMHPSLAVASLTEKGNIVGIILRVCYPIANPPFDLARAESIFEAGRKYQMESVLQYIRDGLSHLVGAPESAVAVYHLACRFEMKEVARNAARDTLVFSLPQLLDDYAIGLNSMPGAVVRSLLDYHLQCCRVAAEVVKTPSSWLPATMQESTENPLKPNDDSASECRYATTKKPSHWTSYATGSDGKVLVPTWVKSYATATSCYFGQADAVPWNAHTPSVDGMMDTFMQTSAFQCNFCRTKVVQNLREMSKTLQDAIRRKQMEVSSICVIQ